MTRVRDWLRARPHSLWALGIGLSFLLAWLSQTRSAPSDEAALLNSIDTFIPSGQVLVPIQIHNSESVDSIFGTHGIVDLYAVDNQGQVRRWPTARAVKMLRAPKNPNQFGVLVPSSRVSALLNPSSLFQVVIHNPKESGPKFESAAPKPRPIVLEDE